MRRRRDLLGTLKTGAVDVGLDLPPPESRRIALLTALLLGLVAVLALLAMDGGVDDAYIVHRYVDRCVHGAGLTFNDGERVEGFTSLAWTLLLLATRLVGIPSEFAGAALNWLAIVLTALVLERLLRRLGVSPAMRMITLLLCAVSFPFFTVCYLGLEFGLYALLLVLLMSRLAAARMTDASPRHARLAGLLGGLLFATRPESALLLPLLLVIGLASLWRRPGLRRPMLECALVWVGIAVVITGWRLAVYGEFLPNSMLAKSPVIASWRPGSSPEVVRAGLTYVTDAMRANPLLPLIFIYTIGLALLAPGASAAPLLLLPMVPGIIISITGGGDWMPGYRFLWGYQPLMLVCFALGAERLRGNSRWRAAVYVLLALICAGGTAAQEGKGHWRPRFVRKEPQMATYAHLGRQLNAVWDPGDVAIPEAIGRFGAAAPRLRIHDHCGLTDRELAHDPNASRNIYGRIDWQVSLKRDPAVIILHYAGHARNWSRLNPRFPVDYEFGTVPVPWLPDRPLFVVLRRDRSSTYGPALTAAGMTPLDYAAFQARIPPE
jgi:hypothetical protein